MIHHSAAVMHGVALFQSQFLQPQAGAGAYLEQTVIELALDNCLGGIQAADTQLTEYIQIAELMISIVDRQTIGIQGYWAIQHVGAGR